jgi:hypothetical protein
MLKLFEVVGRWCLVVDRSDSLTVEPNRTLVQVASDQRPMTHDAPHTPPNAEKPPSMATTVPVTKAEAGDISHNVAPMRSSGLPKRPIGV